MKHSKAVMIVTAIYAFFSFTVFAADSRVELKGLSKIKSALELTDFLSALKDENAKKELQGNADEILAAVKRYAHVQAVIRIIKSSPGSYKKVNVTPQSLKEAFGEIAVFDTLTEVSTKIHKGKAHVYRDSKKDPYDAAFMEHLGYIDTLESVKLVATGIQDSWMAPLLKLTKLKDLYIEGRARLGDASLQQLQHLSNLPDLKILQLAYFGKATDAGLELLAGLKNLEKFTFRGSPIKGHGFAKFKGWTKLKYINFHSNRLDDKGFGYVCEQFPNLEFIKLWHSQGITDASAESLRKLKNLKGIEMSSKFATAAFLKYAPELPLDYMSLSYGVNTPAKAAIATAKSISTLRILKMDGPEFNDENLTEVASIKQVEELTLERIHLNDERIQLLKNFSYLKNFSLVERRKSHWYPDEIKKKVSTTLPNVSINFVQ